MGLKHNLGFWAFLLFFFFFSLLLVISSLHSPAMAQKIRATAKAPSHAPKRFQVYKIKNTRPYLLDEDLKRNSHKKRKKKTRNFDSRPFSAMLPKGFVPPSGSSPCHNDAPESINFYCDYSTTDP